MGWLAMTSLPDPGAGMNQPSSGTPSRAGKETSSYSRPYSDGECRTGDGEPVGEAPQRLAGLLLG